MLTYFEGEIQHLMVSYGPRRYGENGVVISCTISSITTQVFNSANTANTFRTHSAPAPHQIETSRAKPCLRIDCKERATGTIIRSFRADFKTFLLALCLHVMSPCLQCFCGNPTFIFEFLSEFRAILQRSFEGILRTCKYLLLFSLYGGCFHRPVR